MTQQEINENALTDSWADRLLVHEASTFKDIIEPLTHITNLSIKWYQPEIGLVDGVLKIDYMPEPTVGYLNTVSLHNYLSVFMDSSVIEEINAQSVLKIIFDAFRMKLGANVQMSISLEYSDPLDNTIIVALSSGDFPTPATVEE